MRTMKESSNPSTFERFLQREMQSLKESGKDISTAEKLAAEMGLDAATLSKLRRGKRTLTAKQARKIAEHLRPRRNHDELELLTAELLSDLEPGDLRRIVIERWFELYGKPEWAFICEFREAPIAGQHTEFITYIAAAIVRGLTYGMVFPFQHDANDHRNLPVPLRICVRNIWATVSQTYWLIQDEIMRLALEKYRNEDSGSLQRALVTAAGRLRLYHLRGEGDNHCPAIGHRYFYVENRNNPHNSEFWEWLSPDGAETMQKKAVSREQIEAVRIRWFPLIEHFRQRGSLPANDKEIDEFFAAEAGFRRRLEILNPEPTWQVFETEPIEETVTGFLKRNARMTRSGARG
jgi:transcriptional regulator with XRE-family HTH domain